jgi:hypothetical protein
MQASPEARSGFRARVAVPEQCVAGVVALQDQQEAGGMDARRLADRRGMRRRPEREHLHPAGGRCAQEAAKLVRGLGVAPGRCVRADLTVRRHLRRVSRDVPGAILPAGCFGALDAGPPDAGVPVARRPGIGAQ